MPTCIDSYSCRSDFVFGLFGRVRPWGVAYNNMGLLLKDMEQEQDAVDAFSKSAELQPLSSDAYFHLANMQFRLLQVDHAAESYKKAWQLSPTELHLLGKLAHTQQFGCDWQGLAQSVPIIKDELTKGNFKVLNAFEALALCLPPKDLLQVSKAYSGELPVAFEHPRAQFGVHQLPLKLGYVSSDFKKHPVMSVAGGIFESHNHSQFKVSLSQPQPILKVNYDDEF